MSYDPQDYPEHPSPRPRLDGESPGPDPSLDAAKVREMVLMPAIFLLAIVALNFLWVIGFFGYGFIAMNTSPEAFEQAMRQQNPAQADEMKKLGWEPGNVLRAVQTGSFGWGCLVMLTAPLCLFGAIRMLMMRNHGLAMFSAVLVSIPCVSPMACPCFFIGTGIGVWCIVVLLNPDVRAAFR